MPAHPPCDPSAVGAILDSVRKTRGKPGLGGEVQEIGPIVRLQVQASSLKVGERLHRRYDPMPIRAVPALLLDGRGVIGQVAGGEKIEDVHHQDHPASKNRGGSNGVSLCFTAHYDAMRERFGPHLGDGLAGENILVQTDQLLGEEDLAPGLVVQTGDGRQIALQRIIVAAPCVEFGRWALGYPDDARPDRTVADAVAFLADGMRGYYAGYAGPSSTIQVGDRVFVR